MTTVTTDTNYRRVTEGLRTLTAVLAPYVAQELRAELEGEWWSRGVLGVLHENQRRDLPDAGNDEALICKARRGPRCLRIMDVRWNDLFRQKLSREHRTWVKELIATRNKWAHPELLDMADEDAWRALDTMTRLVEQVDAEATERLRGLARTVRYGTAGPSTAAAEAASPAGGEGSRPGRRGGTGAGAACSQPCRGTGCGRGRTSRGPIPTCRRAATGRRSSRRTSRRWRGGGGGRVPGSGRVLRPHVPHRRACAVSSCSPLRRITRQGAASPSIQLKTAFGGGKTHSLLALYHLLRGRAAV